ncbi:MAG: hypothetical protein RQ966_04560 [Acetobacteraceae bacterium]|nr:hypothetical protein [Acetobacteraceae bacterium]
MPDDVALRWEQRLQTIASSLLTLEVNTILKDGMIGQKMPEAPMALHQILQEYREYTEPRLALTEPVLVAACGRLAGQGDAARYRGYLEAWAAGDRPAWPADLAPAPPDRPVGELTNGAESFEALHWIALALRRRMLAASAEAPPEARAAGQRHLALLTRIEENSRQLRGAAMMLERMFSAPSSPAQGEDPRLLALMRDPDVTATGGMPRLFGGTLDQTFAALSRHPRPVLAIDPDLTVLIRKAWELGLEEVLLQTTLSIGGDVLFRVAEMPDGQRAFLAELHRGAVDEGVRQWSMVFATLRDLLGLVTGSLFGRAAI